jgi:hypothetical protein
MHGAEVQVGVALLSLESPEAVVGGVELLSVAQTLCLELPLVFTPPLMPCSVQTPMHLGFGVIHHVSIVFFTGTPQARGV